MMRIIFPARMFSDLKAALFLSEEETCAVLLAIPSAALNGQTNLLVREVYPAPENAYAVRTGTATQLRPEFLVPVAQRAREERLSVIFVHTHPFSEGTPAFSAIDDDGERHLAQFLTKRVPGVLHAALVVGPDGCAARRLGAHDPISVAQVGEKIDTLSDPSEEFPVDDRWDRQMRAFGPKGQAAVQRAEVAIVGTGGTGSVVAQQLAHLGVSDFILIDPDVVDETNLNRLVGATPADTGADKTKVVARLIHAINPSASVRSIREDVTKVEIAETLIGREAIFGCTDSHASRAILNQLAYQYYIPLFDVGVGIVASQGRVTHIAGRVQMAAPGLPCLICGGVIDAVAVRRELQSTVQRAADPYITGFNQPQPAVISLNSTVASLAVTMFMNAFTSVPGVARLQYYNGIAGVVRAAAIQADPACVVCSPSGALGLGNKWPLPGRQKPQ